jgi:hypothetical protein
MSLFQETNAVGDRVDLKRREDARRHNDGSGYGEGGFLHA